MENNLQDCVQRSLTFYEQKDIQALQHELFEMYSTFNKPNGGKKIINYPKKEELCECLTLLIKYDWTNSRDILEVCAENGFYCIIEYIRQCNTHADQSVGGLDLFLLLSIGRKHLIPKVQDILSKSEVIGNTLFDHDDYSKGASYVIGQFAFLSAQIIKEHVFKHDNFLTAINRKYFDEVLTDRSYYHLHPVQIFEKGKFISEIIGSILEDI